MKEMKSKIAGFFDNLLHWTWTKSLLYWMILSAGTASELAFLVASLYVTLNSSVHALIVTVIPESTTVHLSQIATAAYVGLPECILPLGIVTTISHVRTWAYSKRWGVSATWAFLYGIPTLIFLVLSIITISCSLLAVNFQLPDWMIVVRGDTGYAYGIIALVFMYVGKPQEVDRLMLKDESITSLTVSLEDLNAVIEDNNLQIKSLEQTTHNQSEMLGTLQYDLSNKANQVEILTRNLAEKTSILNGINETINDSSTRSKTLEQTIYDQAEMIKMLREQIADKSNAIEILNRSIAEKDELLEEAKFECSRLEEELQLAPATGIHAYSAGCQNWLNSGSKTASIADISTYTGHTKQKIVAAKLQRSTRNPDLIMMKALIEWLEKTPPPVAKKEERTTDKLEVQNGHSKETVNLDEYPDLLV